jgi:hypothetical protein
LLKGIIVKYASSNLECLKNRNIGINFPKIISNLLQANSAGKVSVNIAQKDENLIPKTKRAYVVNVIIVRIKLYPTRCPLRLKNWKRTTMSRYIN